MIENIEEFCRKANAEYEKNGRSELFVKYEELVIISKNPFFIEKFYADVDGSDEIALRQVIIDSKDAEANFSFAHRFGDTEDKSHAKVVIASKDLLYNFYFAYNVQDADVAAHNKIIVDSKHPGLNHRFIVEFGGIDSALTRPNAEAIIASKDPEYNYWCAYYGYFADLTPQHLQVVLDSRDENLNYNCAKNIKEADILAHARIFLKKENFKEFFNTLTKLQFDKLCQKSKSGVLTKEDKDLKDFLKN